MAGKREVTMKKQVKRIQGSSWRSMLTRTCLHQKVLVPVSSLGRGRVVLSVPLLPKLREGRNKPQEEGTALPGSGAEGKRRRKGRSKPEHKHGPASPSPQAAGTWLHKALALNLFLILCPATSKAVSFAKATKRGFRSQGQALIECKWKQLHGAHWSWLRILPSVFKMLLSIGYKQPATMDTLRFRVDFSLLQCTY